jgi:hypothetical protein
VGEAKPFNIPKRVWKAFKRVKANQGAAGIGLVVIAFTSFFATDDHILSGHSFCRTLVLAGER